MSYNPYETVAGVESEATSQGIDEWFDLSANEKKKVVFEASKDIERIHGQAGSTPFVPWMFGNIDLRFACRFQALFRAQFQEFFETREAVAILSDDSYNDGAINISVNKESPIDDKALGLIRKVMDSSDIPSGTKGLGVLYN